MYIPPFKTGGKERGDCGPFLLYVLESLQSSSQVQRHLPTTARRSSSRSPRRLQPGRRNNAATRIYQHLLEPINMHGGLRLSPSPSPALHTEQAFICSFTIHQELISAAPLPLPPLVPIQHSLGAAPRSGSPSPG